MFQCLEPCCQETWDNQNIVREMMEHQEGIRVPMELTPQYPRCGRPLTMNLRSDNRFVEDEGWRAAAGRYQEFLRRHAGKRVLILELGVGYNTPGIIKYPFWRLTAENPKVVYACVDQGQAVCPEEIQKRSICGDEDIEKTLEKRVDKWS